MPPNKPTTPTQTHLEGPDTSCQVAMLGTGHHHAQRHHQTPAALEVRRTKTGGMLLRGGPQHSQFPPGRTTGAVHQRRLWLHQEREVCQRRPDPAGGIAGTF
jgi:hypothetical protein